MRTLSASVLCFEAFVAYFFGLVGHGLHVADSWSVAASLGVACLVVAGLLRFRWAYGLGWLLQFAMILTGFMVTTMFVLGAIFLALWMTGLYYGARVDAVKRQRAASAASTGAEAVPVPAVADPREQSVRSLNE